MLQHNLSSCQVRSIRIVYTYMYFSDLEFGIYYHSWNSNCSAELERVLLITKLTFTIQLTLHPVD